MAGGGRFFRTVCVVFAGVTVMDDSSPSPVVPGNVGTSEGIGDGDKVGGEVASGGGRTAPAITVVAAGCR